MERNLEDKIIAVIRSYNHFSTLPENKMTGEELYMLELLEKMISILSEVGDNHDELVKRYYVHCDKYSIPECSSEMVDNSIALGVAMAMTGILDNESHALADNTPSMGNLYVDDAELADLMEMA